MLFIISVICFFLYGCKKDEILGYKNTNSKKIEEINLFQGKTIAKKIIFLNNPYKFNRNNKVVLYINEDAVFKGCFEKKISLNIPVKYVNNGYISPLLVVYIDEKNSYSFFHKQAIEIKESDSLFEVTFYEDANINDAAQIKVK